MRGGVCGVHAPPGDLCRAPCHRMAQGDGGASRCRGRGRRTAYRRCLGRSGRGALLYPRAFCDACRPRDHFSAAARRVMRRGLQRLQHVCRTAGCRLPCHGCAPLRRLRHGRIDGLWCFCRFEKGESQDWRHRLHRIIYRRDGTFLRTGTRCRHHAACAGGVCRLDPSRSADVP